MSEHIPRPTGFEMKITETDGVTTFSGPPEAFGQAPLPQLPPRPEEKPPKPATYQEMYPEADKAFAYDLGTTQAEGDAFDQRKSLRLGPVGARLALPTAAAAELMASSTGAVPISPAFVVSAATAAGVAGWWSVRHDRKVFGRADDALKVAEQKVGQQYELYRKARIGDKAADADVALYWYEPATALDEHFGVVEGLRAMAQLAKDHDVTEMHVEAHQYEAICRTVTNANYDMPIVSAAPAFKHKGVTVTELKDPPAFVPGTPESWLAFARDITEKSIEANRGTLTIDQVKDKLRALAPDHELLKLVDMHDSHTATEDDTRIHRRKINNVLRTHFVRQEQHSDRAKEYKNNGRPYKPHEIVDAELGNLSPTAEHVIWDTKREGRKLQKSTNALGITDEQYERLIRQNVEQDKELDINTYTTALELALVRHAYGQPISTQRTNKQNVVIPARAWPVKTVQQELSDGKSRGAYMLVHRAKQVAAIGALFISAEAGLVGAHNFADAKESLAVEYSRVQIANQRHVDPGFVSDKDAKDYLHSRSAWYRSYDAFRSVEDTINPHWNDLRPDFSSPKSVPGEGASSSQTDSLVGNTILPDTPDFTITPHNGANPQGFWEAKSSQVLVVQNPSQATGRGFSLKWLQEDLDTDRMATYVMPTTLPKELAHKPILEVHRQLNGNDFFNAIPAHDGLDVTQMTNLPVREGMAPVAAAVDGKKVNIILKNDGTYGITSLKGKAVTGDLTYWLGAYPGRKVRQPGTILELGVVNDKDGSTTLYYDKQLESIPELGQAGKDHYRLLETFGVINDKDGILKSNARQFAKGYQNTIRNDWKYSFTPFKEGDDRNWKSLDDFIHAAETAKKDNCNVANTLVGLKDVESAQVFGYLNGPGSGANVLSKKEAHQKRTDGDATSRVVANELPQQQPLELPVSPGTLELIAGGLVVLSQQRRIRKGLRAAATHRDETLQAAYDQARDAEHAAHYDALQSVGDERIAQALAVTEHALYAPTMTPQSLALSAQRVIDQPTPPAEMLLAKPQYVTGEVVAHVKRQAKLQQFEDPALATELAQSARVLERAEQVLRDRTSEPKIVLSGLTRALNIAHTSLANIRQRIGKK